MPTVAALGFKDARLPDFSYIVTPSLAMNTVLQQKTPDPRIRVLLVYYAGQKSIALKGQSSDRIVQRTLWRPSGLKARLNACVRFLLAGQHRDGYWQGKWFPSRLITTRYAARLCKQFPETCADALARAQAFVLQGQHLNGSWNDSVIDTANAILLLRETEGLNDACKRGEKWLVNRKKTSGCAGEPVLYYWFDMPGGNRVFYHCIDTGAVTRAWALLALEAVS